VIVSLCAIALINGIYNDLYQIFKVSYKESLLGLLFLKWSLILFIVMLNIYKIKRVSLSKEEQEEILSARPTEYSPAVQNLIEKETLISTTDLIIEKYKR
jgi:hypothetical protein